jgi:hypothetical protein
MSNFVSLEMLNKAKLYLILITQKMYQILLL